MVNADDIDPTADAYCMCGWRSHAQVLGDTPIAVIEAERD